MATKNDMLATMQRVETYDKNALMAGWRAAMADRPTVMPWVLGVAFASFMTGAALTNFIDRGPSIVTAVAAFMAALTVWQLRLALWLTSENSSRVALLNRLRQKVMEAEPSITRLMYDATISRFEDLRQEHDALKEQSSLLHARCAVVSQQVKLERGDLTQFRAGYQMARVWTSVEGQALLEDIQRLKLRHVAFVGNVRAREFETQQAEMH